MSAVSLADQISNFLDLSANGGLVQLLERDFSAKPGSNPDGPFGQVVSH